MKKRMMWTKE